MNWVPILAVGSYALLAIAGTAVSGVPKAYWQGILKPALMGTRTSQNGKPTHDLLRRLTSTLTLALLLVLIGIALSPLAIYRLFWELWHLLRRGPPPLPPSKSGLQKWDRLA